MTRIYVEDPSVDTPENIWSEPLADRPYFTAEKARRWPNAAEWDGSNNVDVNTRDQNRGQALLRTAQGRWVLEHWSNWQNEPDRYVYVTEDDARDWLLRNEHDDAVRELFGEPAEERGPGRPEIGGRIVVMLGNELLARVDAWRAALTDSSTPGVDVIPRATAIRTLVAAGLDAMGV